MKEGILKQIIRTDYGALNSDLGLYNIDAVSHFEQFGKNENRKFSFLIDEDYIRSTPEFKNQKKYKTGIELFLEDGGIAPNNWLDLEYIQAHNKEEIRDWRDAVALIYANKIRDVSPFFDADYYVNNAARAGLQVQGHPLLHYLSTGWKSGIDFHPFFDIWYFLEANAIQDIVKPYLYYLFEDRLYGISPFIEIGKVRGILAKTGKQKPYDIYRAIFSNDIKLSDAHNSLRDNILNYIYNDSAWRNNRTNEFALLKTAISELRSQGAPRPQEVEISVVIVNYHKAVLTLLSALSAIRALQSHKFEIIIIDNETHPFQAEIMFRYLANYKNVKIITLKENTFFGEANNLALEKCRGDKILLLNNDAFINRKAVDCLLRELEGGATASAPIAVNHMRKIIEVGGTINIFNDTIQNHKGITFSEQKEKELEKLASIKTDYASAACIMIKKEFLDEYGGFDLRYEPVYYEDADLCKRITHTGHKLTVNTQSHYLHLENTTTKDFFKNALGPVITHARGQFLEKWATPSDCALETPAACPAPIGEVGIYTPFKISFGGGENYILSVAAELAKRFNITLITENPVSQYRLSSILAGFGIRNFKCELRQPQDVVSKHFDLIISMGNQIVPDRQFNTHKTLFLCQFPFPIHYVRQHPNGGLAAVDRIICYSEFAKKNIESEIGRYDLSPTRIDILSPPIRGADYPFAELKAAKNKRLTFVSVGRFIVGGHRKNQEKILNALLRVAENHDIEAYILGGLGFSEGERQFYEGLLTANTNANIVINSNVSRERLREAYSRSHFYIHATGMDRPNGVKNYVSEHFGMTIVEAMSYGCIPIVYNHGGPAEIIRDCRTGLTYQNSEELYNLLNLLCSQAHSYNRLATVAQQCVENSKKYMITSFNANLNKIVDETLGLAH